MPGSAVSDDLIQHIRRNATYRDGHMFWAGSRGRLKFQGKNYSVKNVLNGRPPAAGYVWRAVCGAEDCVNPDHCQEDTKASRAVRRPVGPTHTQCLKCGRRMRAHGAKVADYPGTVAQGGRGLCQTCHKWRRSDNVSPYTKPLGWSRRLQALWAAVLPDGDTFEFDPEVVRRTVPNDLWGYFGVEA